MLYVDVANLLNMLDLGSISLRYAELIFVLSAPVVVTGVLGGVLPESSLNALIPSSWKAPTWRVVISSALEVVSTACCPSSVSVSGFCTVASSFLPSASSPTICPAELVASSNAGSLVPTVDSVDLTSTSAESARLRACLITSKALLTRCCSLKSP